MVLAIVEDYVTFCPKFHVLGQSYSGVWKELPKDWLEGLNIAKQVTRIFLSCFISSGVQHKCHCITIFSSTAQSAKELL